jgi:hypothetical protein
MKTKDAISRVRDSRKMISDIFNNDPVKLVEHYEKLQEKHKYGKTISNTYIVKEDPKIYNEDN